MSEKQSCPICGAVHGGTAKKFDTVGDRYGFDCDVCGRFEISGSALGGRSDAKYCLTPLHRALLSHHLRLHAGGDRTPMITTDFLDRILPDGRLPSPSIQAANLIRVIGDCMSAKGEPYFPDQTTPAAIGSLNSASFQRLLSQLIERGTVLKAGSSKQPNSDGGTTLGPTYDLSLEGWEEYEAEQKGQIAGKYGFIALKFDDPTLDPFIEDIVKPVVRDRLRYRLIHMRDVAQAGVIDNIMRSQIRDSAFVLVDLTHDNSGAYWEAGYAEGLGKPVIYICEKAKFEDAKTHFDTNHCTTVLWTAAEPEPFKTELIATLRRSLNLFPVAGE